MDPNGNPDTKEILRIRIERVQRVYNRDNIVFRVLWIVVGITLLAAGLAMTVLPGPAIIVLPVGLAMLAAEFVWARRLLNLGIERGVDVKRRIQQAPAAVRVLGTLAVACGLAALVVFVLLR